MTKICQHTLSFPSLIIVNCYCVTHESEYIGRMTQKWMKTEPKAPRVQVSGYCSYLPLSDNQSPSIQYYNQ